MTYDALLALVGRLVAARHPDRAEEIVATAREAGRDGSRWAELASLFALLIVGVLDARLAAAATLFWLFRLVTSDLADPQIVRWVAMLAGVVLAAHVTRLSIRRAAVL